MPITNKSPVSATNSKESPAAPAKPDEKKPAEAVKAATDSKAAPAAPAKPDEKKPNEATKTASDNKAAPTALAKSDEKKPSEAVKTATDNKIAPAVPAKPDEKKPNEAAKTAADSKAAPVAAAKPDEKKTAEAVKTATDSKAAPAAPVKPDEKKPAEANKAAMDSKAAPATPAKPDEKKPTEAVKAATDSKAAPAVPAKPDEKKPIEAAKTVTDTKAAPTAPAKPDEKKPTEANKVVNFPTSAGESKPEKAAAPTEDEYNDPKDVRLSIGAVETDKITSIKISEMHRFEGHPFKVEDNKDMMELVESIKQFGVMEPAVVIPRKEGGYEIVSGHRRHRACELAGLTSMPVIVRNLDRDEAIISMVDANLKRENISPMEKARAYEMRLEAMKRKAGRRSKSEMLKGDKPIRADEELAQQVGESRATIQRFTRLTKLEPELQQMVDEKKLPVNTAADLSYLKKEEQKQVVDAIKKEDKVPSGAQAAEMKKDSQAGKLTSEKIQSTVAPSKKEAEPVLKVTLGEDELRPYFPDKRTTIPDVKAGIFQALKLWQKAIERQQAKAAEEKAASKAASKSAPSKPSLKR